MKNLKNVSDELWLGLVFMLSAIWLFAVKPSYIIISGVFMFVGIVLLIVDSLKKAKSKQETPKNGKKENQEVKNKAQ